MDGSRRQCEYMTCLGTQIVESNCLRDVLTDFAEIVFSLSIGDT